MLPGLLVAVVAAAVVAAGLWLWLRPHGRRAPARTAAPPTRESGSATRSAAADVPSSPSADGALGYEEALRRLYEVAFGAVLEPEVPPEHAKVAAAAAGVLQSAAADQRYVPRRPLLLPRLLRAMSDAATSRRELAQIISGDASLVANLLKLANSPLYRLNSQPVESVDRALAVLGTDGVRSLVAVALVQPVFQSTSGEFSRFAETIWEHACRAGTAAEMRAVTMASPDPFAAQLLALVTGLGEIVVFRVALEQYASRPTLAPNATAIAALLEAHEGRVARRIASSWELPFGILEALEDPLPGKPVTAAASLRRSLRFGLHAGALAVLAMHGVIDDATGLASLAAAGGAGQRFERLWVRLKG
jgi:HD-like signal output (HDOD) protein